MIGISTSNNLDTVIIEQNSRSFFINFSTTVNQCLRLLCGMFENMAKQMIQQKQLWSNASFEEELDMEKRKDEFRSYQKKSSKLDAQSDEGKEKAWKVLRMKVFEKKPNKIVDEVHKERNGTENANDSQMMTILSTILENGKKRDENLVAWVTNMENELQESQYDNDF